MRQFSHWSNPRTMSFSQSMSSIAVWRETGFTLLRPAESAEIQSRKSTTIARILLCSNVSRDASGAQAMCPSRSCPRCPAAPLATSRQGCQAVAAAEQRGTPRCTGPKSRNRRVEPGRPCWTRSTLRVRRRGQHKPTATPKSAPAVHDSRPDAGMNVPRPPAARPRRRRPYTAALPHRR